MYNQRTLDQAAKAIKDRANKPKNATDIVRSNCWTDTLRDILESYVAMTARSPGGLSAAIRAILAPGYFESFAQDLFDAIKKNGEIPLLSPRRFEEIRMLVQNFETLEAHFLARYRLTSSDWNAPRSAELRNHLAEIRATVDAFVASRRTNFDVDSALGNSDLVSRLLRSEAGSSIVARLLVSAGRPNEARLKAVLDAVHGAVCGNADPYGTALSLSPDSVRDLETLRASSSRAYVLWRDALSPLWYDAERIESIVSELEIGIELLLEVVRHPEELDAIRDEIVGATGISEAGPSGISERPMADGGAETSRVPDADEADSVPASRRRPVVERSHIGVRMTRRHMETRGHDYWLRIRTCMRHDHAVLIWSWLRDGFLAIDAVHPATRRTLLHLAVECGATKIVRLLVRRNADWLAKDVEGREPIRRILFQKPLRRDFFTDVLWLVPLGGGFRESLGLLEAELRAIAPNVRDESRRADLDFLLDHIALISEAPKPETEASGWPNPVPLPESAVKIRLPETRPEDTVADTYRALLTVDASQRERLREIWWSDRQINYLFLWLAQNDLAAIDFTRGSLYSMDPEDTDVGRLRANEKKIRERIASDIRDGALRADASGRA